MNDQPLAKLDLARHALAECKTAMEAKQISDVAEAARVYLERTNASAETVNEATEIRLLAERQMGAFLKRTPVAVGGNPKSPPVDAAGGPAITRGQMGISHHEATRAQKLADIPEPEFKERIAVVKAGGEKLSTAKVINLGSRRRVSNQFNLAAWKKQTRSVMTSWLQSVPESEAEEAVKYLTNLPSQIIIQIK
jgi:hypothetical protein